MKYHEKEEYREFMERQHKYLIRISRTIAAFAILMILYLLFASCQKEEVAPCKTCDVNVEFLPSTNGDASCKTCDINVRFWSASVGSHSYIESSKVYCNGEWAYIDGVVDVTSGENSGVAWHKTSTTTCHD